MIRFKYLEKPFQLASEWEELSQKQLLALVPYTFSVSGPKKKLEVLALLVPTFRKKYLKSLSPEEQYELLQLTNWIWEKKLETAAIDSFTFKKEEYFLPKPDLDDTVAIEFAMADLFLKEFVDSGESQALDKLIATIARPRKSEAEINSPDWDGVTRHKYNGALADRRAKDFADLPISVKVVVLQMFIRQQSFLHQNYDIFSKPSAGAKTDVGFDIGWVSLIYDLAEQAVFGDFDKVCFTNMNTIALYLHKKKKLK